MPTSLKESLGRRRAALPDEAVLKSRLGHLPRADGDLMRAVLLWRQPTRVLAQQAGVSQRSIQRQVHKLMERVLSPRFVCVTRAIKLVSPLQARFAVLSVCHGLSLPAVARRMDLRPHAARRLACEIEGILNGMLGLKEVEEALAEPGKAL